MIDWVNAVLPFKHDRIINGGECLYLSNEPTVGHCVELETPTGIKYITGTTQKKAMARGSYDSKVAIQSSRDHITGTHIWVSGSPKVLQGHNLFGSEDPRKLAANLARHALQAFGYETDELTFERWLRGDGVKFTRIDVTQMLDVGSEHNASEWLRAVAEFATLKHRGRGREDHGTVYFGKTERKTSRRWILKLYRKFAEIESRLKSHRLPEDIPERERLLDYALGTVRAEITFQSMELKKLHLDRGEMWKSIDAAALWKDYMDKLDLPGNFRLEKINIDALPRGTREAYFRWERGDDLRQVFKVAAFYKHRAILKRYGIDIATPCNRRGIVKPMIRVIEAHPKQIPSWAQNTPLLYAA